MHYNIHDIAGNLGVAMIIITYLLLQLGRIRSDNIYYSLLNAAGAGLIIYSLIYEFNLSAFIIEAFWVVISFIGIIRNLYITKRKK